MKTLALMIGVVLLGTVVARAQEPATFAIPADAADNGPIDARVRVAPDKPDLTVRIAQAPRPATPVAPKAPVPPAGPPPAPQPVAPPAPPRPEPSPTQSVRLEVTITDASAAGAPAKKTIMMLIADSKNGRIRTNNAVHTPSGDSPVVINVDARAAVRPDARIQIDLTVEYMPIGGEPGGGLRPSQLSESLGVLLSDGKPTLVSQSADPITDRRISLELTATIVK